MVISTRPLVEICPVVPAAMEGRQIVQWDKDSCADAGFLKIDLLGLGMLSAVERCVEEIGRAQGRAARPLADTARRPRDLLLDPPRRDHRRLPDREPRPDADAPPHPAAGPRRPHGAGGAGAAGADPGRRHPPLHRAAEAAARGPLLRGPLRPPLAGAGPARHPRRDRLPGAGDRGGDGARRLQLRGGRGAAPGDEPEALGGRPARLPRSLRRRRGRARGPESRSPRRSSARSRGSPASASPRPTPSPSACWPTSRPGCGSTTGRSSSPRC